MIQTHSTCQITIQPISGTAAQDPLPQDNTATLDDDCKKCIQQIVGALLYYAQAVDLTILPALSSIASEQAEATKNTEKQVTQLLDYMAMHPDATVHFHALQTLRYHRFPIFISYRK